MKTQHLQLLIISLCLILPTLLHAQIGINPGANVKPKQDVELYTRNGFLVQLKYNRTTADPNASINNISCVSPPTTLTALAGTLKDPAGDSPYTAGVTYNCAQFISIPTSSTASFPLGIEITFAQLDTEADKDVVSFEGSAGTIQFSGNTLPATFIYPGDAVLVRFSTNNNATVGQGFLLQWRALLIDPGAFTPVTPTPFAYSMYFGATTGALRAGYLVPGDVQNMGYYSAALGFGNTASGTGSIALGMQNTAKGNAAITLGESNTVGNDISSGGFAVGKTNSVSTSYGSALGISNVISSRDAGSVTMGFSNTIAADNSGGNGSGSMAFGTYNSIIGAFGTAIGYQNSVTGSQNVAIGRDNISGGQGGSIVLGSLGTNNGYSGSMMLADNNVSFSNISTVRTATGNTTNNQLTARFSNGFRFITNYNTNTGAIINGAVLGPGANAWAAISDSARKERFLSLNHSDLLAKIRTLRLGTWNYKGQREQRHYGPMAQDFFVRFGHDALGVIGCDTLLNSHDFTAVTLSGVQALAMENEQLKAELAQVKQEHTQTIDQLKARLEALERSIFIRPAARTSLVVPRKRIR